MPDEVPNLSVAEQLFYTTLRIKALSSGTVRSQGTGFIFQFDGVAAASVPALVTNKHVLEGSDELSVMFHQSVGGRPSGDFIECRINSSAAIMHPDADIDLCAIPLGPVLHKAVEEGRRIFFMGLTRAFVPDPEDWKYFDAIEPVTMIGCPKGILDEFNNLPISRRGITASPLSKDYESRPEFMVDMACFPGSSGSPILIVDNNGYLDRKKNSYQVGGSRLFLVGILYGGPVFDSEGRIVTSEEPTVQVASMMHLGNCVKSTELSVLQSEIDKIASS